MGFRAEILLLGGPMGSGKSTVGRVVAERAGAKLVDLDAVIAGRAGRSVAELFASEGEAGFRALEAAELHRVLDAPIDGRPRVVALGGGALVSRSLRRTVLERGCLVGLMATPETLEARTSEPGRPLLDRAANRREALARILEARADAYAEAHGVVATDGLSPEEVAERVVAIWNEAPIVVPLGARTYSVRLGGWMLERAAAAVAGLRPSKTFVVTDANVARAWGEALAEALAGAGCPPARTVVLEPGEENKHLGSVERALRAFVEAGADRDAVVIGHGGGVVTDIAGFVAATLLRGVRWVGVPTTLLAMVDASVGGKTGVDLGPAKNAVGAFHQPAGVFIDVAHLTTESARGYASGLAEVVKSAAVGDARLFERLAADPGRVRAREPGVVEDLVRSAVDVKARIVGRDERESGERALLNFGHTVGHALESEGGYARLTHGEAVSLGMVAALRIGVRLGVTPAELAGRVTGLLEALGLPVDLDAQPLERALPLVTLDKKRRGGRLRFVLVRRLGEAFVHPLDAAELPELCRPGGAR